MRLRRSRLGGADLAMTAGIGIGVGAGLALLLDPADGARRRGLARDKSIHAARELARAAEIAARDVAHRARGVAARWRARFQAAPGGDEVLALRVRATLGHKVSHPRSVEVVACEGVVDLRGPVLADEKDRLVSAVKKVRGVERVHDQLTAYSTADGVPGLQGGTYRQVTRAPRFVASWTPATRLLAGAAGAALALFAPRLHRAMGAVMTLTSAGLLAQAVANRATRRAEQVPEAHRESVKAKAATEPVSRELH